MLCLSCKENKGVFCGYIEIDRVQEERQKIIVGNCSRRREMTCTNAYQLLPVVVSAYTIRLSEPEGYLQGI
jgi:hypothetical protein